MPLVITWWDEGVRFECQGSGKCCASRGEYGYVYLTNEDMRRFAKGFQLPVSQFRKKYCRRTGGFWHLKDPDADCIFLDGKKCSVYDSRPEQCRTWPFWPENMNAKVWTEEIASFCPGIGQGRIHSKEEIRELLKRDPVEPLKD